MTAITWTQQEISDWADETFGHVESWEVLAERVLDECDELVDASIWADCSFSDQLDQDKYDDKMVEECADIYITMVRFFTYMGRDLQTEVDKKMIINASRKWKNTGAGVGKHIED